FLNERKLIKSAPLSALSDTRLGIDVQTYLNKLFLDFSTKEPMVAAMGGHPLALISHIESDLRFLEKSHIKPVFIFNGLHPSKKLKSQHNDQRSFIRSDAWSAYEQGRIQDAINSFGQRQNLFQPDLLRLIHKLFRQRHVEFLTAPYLSWPQLVYLLSHPKSYIHAIFGSTEHLLYPQVDKLITSLDLQGGTFNFVQKRSLLQDIKLSQEQFFDLGLLAGIDICPTFPPASYNFDFKQLIETVRHAKSGWFAVQNFVQSQQSNGHESSHYVESFQKAVILLKFSLILAAEEGRVLPLPLAIPPPPPQPALSSADIPSDLGDVFSPRLPDEVYFHLCRGLVGPWAINTLAQGGFQELPPLCNGETQDYKNFVKDYITESNFGPRAVAIALIASTLHPFWRNRQVHAHYYFHSHSTLVPHNSSTTTDLIKRIDHWNVPANVIEDELRRQNSSTIDFALCLGATSIDKSAERTITAKNTNGPVLHKKDEIVANTIWRFLELRSLLTPQHTHTPFGRAMHNALTVSRLNDKFQEPLLILVELLRAKVLHDRHFSNRQFSGGPSFGTEEEKKSMLLIIRTLSIVPLQFKPEQWSGPLSKELLVFNSFQKTLSRSLRTLVESISMNAFLKNNARRAREDYLDIALSLPFQNDINTGFGIFFKIYLDALTTFAEGSITEENKDSENVKEAKQSAKEILGEAIPNVRDAEAELMRGFRFWDAVSSFLSLYDRLMFFRYSSAFVHSKQIKPLISSWLNHSKQLIATST
ncbi:viral life cycle-related protein, partial [Wallemia mellicola CBS 633.66]